MYLRSGAGARSFQQACIKSHAPRSDKARLSQCVKLCSTSKVAETPRSEWKQDDGGREKQKGDKVHKSTRIPALAIAVVGFPLGWYFSDYRGQGRSFEVSDRADFVKYTLVGKETVSSTCSVFRLRPATRTIVDIHDPSLDRSLISIELKQPQLQIARSYTLLPPEHDQDIDELRLLIRKESRGEVSNFVHRLPLDAEVEVRGPYVEFTVPENLQSVAFLAGGTGIAPALQVADIVGDAADMHILWATRRREDCRGGTCDTLSHLDTSSWWARIMTALSGQSTKTEALERTGDQQNGGPIVKQLKLQKRMSTASRQDTPRLLVDYLVDDEDTFITPEIVTASLLNLTKQNEKGDAMRKILFVSGPPGFINHWAGPKQWVNGQERQGPLGGVVTHLDLKDWEVVKL